MTSRGPLLAGLGVLVLVGTFAAGRLTGPPQHPGAEQSSADHPVKPASDDITLAAEAQRSVGLRLATVTRRALQGHLGVTAIVSADQERSATLRPFGRGRVLTVDVRPGDPVRRGEVLVTYDDAALSDLRAQITAARSAQSQADQAAMVAREAYGRGRALAGTVLPAAEVERRRATLAEATAGLATQRATLLDLHRRLALFSPAGPGDPPGVSALRSPLDGTVLSVSISPGDMVEAGQAMVALADLSDVWVLASVFQDDVGRIEPGGQAIVSVPGLPHRVFAAAVADIGHSLDLATGAVQVRLVVANPDLSLRIGMLADAALPTRDAREGLTIPSSSVQRIDGKPVVFVAVGGDKFHRQRIETGLQTPDSVVVRDGLHEGDRVVTEGSFALKSQALQSEISGD